MEKNLPAVHRRHGFDPGSERSLRVENGIPLIKIYTEFPCAEEIDRPQSQGSQTVRHNWGTESMNAHTHTHTHR